MIRIEVLFPEFCSLFADSSNVRYLKCCLPDAEFVETAYTDEPLFATEKPDLIYMGAMTERAQEMVIQKLMPYKDRLAELIDKGTVFLITGNALELFGQYIQDKDNKIPMLGIFDFHSERDFDNRINYIVVAKYGDMDIIGVKSQFSQIYGLEKDHFLKMVKGLGDNLKSQYEGVHRNNFYGTFSLGPFLVNNPDFTKHLLRLLHQNDELVYEEDLYAASKERFKKYSHPDAPVDIGLHGF
jgi:CobQ-like glutamine amidotransferase family enzyme